MELTRRKVLALAAGTTAFAALSGLPAFASLTDDAIAELTGGPNLKVATLGTGLPSA